MSTPEQQKTDDLLQALAAADALETFQRLPLEEQTKFSAWIARAPDDESYRRRIEILVMGMRMAPPIKAPVDLPSKPPDFWTNPLRKS